MKFFLNRFFLILIFNFLLITNVKSASNVFYIDLDFILQNSKIGKNIINELNTIDKKNLIKYDKIEKDLKQIELNLINSKKILSEEDFNVKMNEFKIKVENFLLEKKNSINEYEKIRKDKFSEFFKEINPVVEKYMIDNSIDLLLEKKNIFISKSDYDISSKIIEKIEK